MLIMPIIVLFYKENGLTNYDVMLLQAIYSVSTVLLEIPSGYFADVWGRKNTIILGSILGVTGFAIYSLSHGFYGFLLAEITLGIGQSFISGSDSALLYDTLQESKRKNDYVKLEGRTLSIGNFAETLAAFTGGALATISLRTPFIAQTFVALIAVPAAFMLVEPKRITIAKASIKNILSIVKYSLIEHKGLRLNVIYAGIVGSATLSMAWLIQIYLKEVLLLSEWNIGLVWGALNLIVGLTSLIAYKIERKYTKAFILFLIAILVSTGFISLGLLSSYWAFLPMFVFYFARGIATPVLKDYINRLTTSDIRATVLSVRNAVIRIIFAGLIPLYGWYADVYTISQAYVFAGTIYIISTLVISGFITSYYIKRVKSKLGNNKKIIK
jgi:MFS family permease